MPFAIVFPGQGAASPGMGRAWADHPAWHIVVDAEATLDRPLAHLLLDATAAELAPTDAGQLSVLLTSLMAWEATAEVVPDNEIVAFAGHSLGQLTALFAAGALAPTDGYRLAAARADASQESAWRNHGRMCALLGATLDQAAAAIVGIDEVWLANDNAPGQVVIAGRPTAVDQARSQAKEVGVRRTAVLDVGHAFHTPLLVDAAAAWQPQLAATPFATTSVPVVSNTDAQPHGTQGDATDWVALLTRHLVEPVRWRESQQTLAALGATTLVEVGPGTILSGLAKRTVPDLATHHVETPEDAAELGAALAGSRPAGAGAR